MDKEQLDKLLEIRKGLHRDREVLATNGALTPTITLTRLNDLVDLLVEVAQDKKKEEEFRNREVEDPGGYEYD